jgi:hypothetical protein
MKYRSLKALKRSALSILLRTPFRQGFTSPDARDFVHLDFFSLYLELYVLDFDAAHRTSSGRLKGETFPERRSVM